MNKNFYSPTMLTKYINCKHIISNEYYEESLKLKRKKRTITDELRIEKGLYQGKIDKLGSVKVIIN